MTPFEEILRRKRARTVGSPLQREAQVIGGPSNSQMEQILERNPEMRDIALGEDYGSSGPGLYRMPRAANGGVSSIERFDPSRSSFMPGESAGMPDSFWRKKFPFLRSTQRALEQQPGYAPLGGGGDQAPSVLTDRNRDAITRPRTTSEDAEAPESRQRAVTFNPATGRPNEDYYRERHDPAGLYSAYENWVPHGGKRGFKNSLKAGALAAARIAQNTDNPAAILTGFGIGAAGGGVNPNFKNNLVRGFKLQQVGGELGDQLKLQREQANIDAAQMIPVTLDNGQTVMVPAKSAGTLASRQQEIDIRGNTLEARKKRWNQLGEHEAATEAQQLYNSGAADDSAELRAEIAKRLRLPAGTVLPPRGLGNQIKTDEFGNFVVVNPRSATVTNTGTKSYQVTQEQGRDTRQRRALGAAKERVQMQQSGANQRAGMRGTGPAKLDGATKREIAKGVGSIESVKNELAAIDAEIQKIDNAAKGRTQTPEEIRKLTALGRQRQQKVNDAKAMTAQLDALDPNNETGVGEGGYPYRKPRAAQAAEQSNGGGQYAGRRISRANVAVYGQRHGMTSEQAEEYLRREGAIIY